MTVAFSVIGDPRDLHPIVRDEVYRVGYRPFEMPLHIREPAVWKLNFDTPDRSFPKH